jgi:hypothetical protein
MFIMMLVYYFFWGGVLRRAFIVLGLRCYAHSLFFSMGHIFFLFLLLLLYIFFENHGLGLGTALFRLGTRVSPAMQKNFNLPWEFFQMVGENWGLKLVKPPLSGQTWFGNSSKRSGKNWDLTLVKSQLDNQTWLGNSSKRSGTNWDLTLSRIAIG